jgi:hypothetical protein
MRVRGGVYVCVCCVLVGSCKEIGDGDTFHLGGAKTGATFILHSLNSAFGYQDWMLKDSSTGLLSVFVLDYQ